MKKTCNLEKVLAIIADEKISWINTSGVNEAERRGGLAALEMLLTKIYCELI